MELTRFDITPTTILLVDNDPLMLTAMGAVMDMRGHRALLARNEEVAFKAIADNQIDLMILAIVEINTGCELAQRLRSFEQSRDVPVIFLVPQLNAEWSAKLSAQGGIYSLLQPVDPHALLDLVTTAIWMPHVAQSRLGVPASHLSSARDWIRL